MAGPSTRSFRVMPFIILPIPHNPPPPPPPASLPLAPTAEEVVDAGNPPDTERGCKLAPVCPAAGPCASARDIHPLNRAVNSSKAYTNFRPNGRTAAAITSCGLAALVLLLLLVVVRLRVDAVFVG